MAAPWEYIFNAQDKPGAPTTYPAMEARRRIAAAMLAGQRKGYPKNFGEGLTAIGDALGDRGVLNQLALQEAGYTKQALAGAAQNVPAEARTPGPQTEDTSQEPPARTAYATESSDTPAATPAGYQPAPAYLRTALAQDVADPERRAYLGQLASKEAQSPDEVSSTGAAGPFQFTRGTGAQYGLMPDGQDLRTDIHGSIAAVQNLTDDNAATLTKMLGRPPSPGELALAHQQGAVTAGRMLTGVGNAPAGNLAVNNVNPGAAPQATAAKIMGYYGMPGSRDALAATMAQRQEVPQPNPTVTGAQAPSAMPSPSGSALPLGGDNSRAMAFGGLPPEITTGASAIRPAPTTTAPIQPAPTQVAQAQPSPIPRVTPPPRMPLPADQPMNDIEKQGWKLRSEGAALGDPDKQSQGQALIAYGAAKSKQEYDARLKDWQDQMLARRQKEIAEETFVREGGPIRVAKEQAELTKAQDEARLRQQLGNLPKDEVFKQVDASKVLAKTGQQALIASQNATKALDGGAILGSGANQRLDVAKFFTGIGLVDKGNIIANTEVFKAAMQPIVASILHQTSGTSQLSDNELAFAKSAAAGNITLDPSSIRQLLTIIDKRSNEMIKDHQTLTNALFGENNPKAKALYGVEAPKAADPLEGRTATGPNGQQRVRRNGQWVEK